MPAIFRAGKAGASVTVVSLDAASLGQDGSIGSAAGGAGRRLQLDCGDWPAGAVVPGLGCGRGPSAWLDRLWGGWGRIRPV